MNNLKTLFDTYLNIKIKKHTLTIVQKYLDAGYECWVVGGPVRDLLLELSPKDIDFATNCPLEITKQLFDIVIPTGEDHGTLTIHLDGENYEVTRYRKDVETDGRRATIEYAETIEEDLMRRDLTVNAIAFNPITGAVVDAVGGLEDFKNRIIRFVGNATDRINEDRLRVLRYLRFISRLNRFGFRPLVDEFEEVMNAYDPNIVSVERIYQELNGMFKIIKDDDTTKDLLVTSLQRLEIFRRFGNKEKMDKVIKDLFVTYDYFPLLKSMYGNYQILKLGIEYKKLYQLFDEFNDKDFSDRVIVKDLLEASKGDFGIVERVFGYFKVFENTNNHNVGLITLNTIKNKVGTVDEEPFMISQLALTGGDLMEYGLKGKEIGETQRKLLQIVKINPTFNNKTILVTMI